MNIDYYDSPTFLGQKDKYLLGLSLPELMVAMAIGGGWFFVMLFVPLGMMFRLLLSLPLTGVSMLILFVRISGLSIPAYLLLSLVRLFRRPSYEDTSQFILEGQPAWLQIQQQNLEKGSGFLRLLGRGRRAASIPEVQKAELKAEVDRQVNDAAVAAEGWARDAIRILARGK